MLRGQAKKQKMSNTEENMETTPAKNPKLDEGLSPSSKARVIKLEAYLCNGRHINKLIKLGDDDHQRIWTKALGRDWDDVKGCIGKKFDNGIKIAHELFHKVTIKSIINDLKFPYQRNALIGPKTFMIRVQGLHNYREAKIGEVVRVNARGINFEVTPGEIIEWMDEYGTVIGEHRYSLPVTVLTF